MIEKVTLELAADDKFVAAGKCGDEELNPRELMLYAAASCMGQTTLHILNQEEAYPKNFEISLSGELSTEIPRTESIFKSFHMVCNIACATEEDQEKASRAVRMANEKYSGLVQMMRLIAPLSLEVAIVSTDPVTV